MVTQSRRLLQASTLAGAWVIDCLMAAVVVAYPTDSSIDEGGHYYSYSARVEENLETSLPSSAWALGKGRSLGVVGIEVKNYRRLG